jgi:hypothetical protein
MGVKAEVIGIPELKAALASVVPKLRVRALRNALAAGARLVRDAARLRAPVLKTSTLAGASAIKRGVRQRGTVRNALSVRTSKLARRRGDVGVFVNVRPARGTKAGAKKPTDPFYWQWLQFGWTPASGSDRNTPGARKRRRADVVAGTPRKKAGQRFLEAGAAQLQAAVQVFVRAIGPAIDKINRGKTP